MPAITTKTYSTDEMKALRKAFAFLNEADDNGVRADATNTQLKKWLERQLRAKLLQHYSQIEGTKAEAAARVSLGAV